MRPVAEKLGGCAATARSSASPPASARADRDCPAPAAGAAAPRSPSADRPSRRARSRRPASRCGIGRQLGPGALRKADHRHAGAALHGIRATSRAFGAITQRSNCSGLRLPAQLSNNCTASTPASIWPREIIERQLGDRVDAVAANALGIAIGQPPRLGLVLRSLPRHHIGRHGPGRPREAQEGRLGRQRRRAPGAPSRRPAPAAPGGGSSASSGTSSSGGARRGPSPAPKRQILPHRLRHHRISENRIAPSKPNRRIGCSVTSAAAALIGRPAPGSRPCRPAARDIPADSARPAASATPAADRAVRRAAPPARADRPFRSRVAGRCIRVHHIIP